ncbi:unnamed protein product, partial [Mesorhabditis belari]|uniref:Carboxylic ester hydrolase n=1 Tax=Mesorhabditis belari TaxID=2138241 RepID=A0AAF3F640_9BILA
MLLFLCSFAIFANAENLVTVTTDLGDIQGFHVDYGTDSSQLYYGNADIFLGIPYVEPPLGDLRFAKPKPITKFPQPMINATSWKPACPQAEPCGTMKAPYDEDCLYLNVFAPNGSRTPANKAVMVFIHGGSFDSGCAQEYPYKAGVRTFVSQDVIVVTIQYRLGFWGFFTTLTDDYPANRGLLDQIEALKWVQNNIAKFGGDPKKVTIFGESAGSASVSAHSFSPLSRGLFAQTIQESGAALTCLKTIAQSVEQAGKMYTGQVFSSLMQQEVDFYLANNNTNVYLWEQSYASNVGRIYRLPGDWDPVPHCAELFFMWVPEDEWTRAINASEVIPFDWEVANWYSKTWTTFAKTGKPTTDDSWTAVRKDANLYWRLDKPEKRGMQMGDSWREVDSVLWNRVFPSIMAQPITTSSSSSPSQPSTSLSTAPTDSTKTSIPSFRIFNIVLVLVLGLLKL